MKTISQENSAKICGGGMYGPGFDDMYAYKPLPTRPDWIDSQTGLDTPPQTTPQPPAQGDSMGPSKGRK